MKLGALSDYFVGVGTKVLKGTEVDPCVSHGHELQGVTDFVAFLGRPAEKTQLPVTYAWIPDDAEPEFISDFGTWYDSRRDQPHRQAECRLYYPSVVQDVVYRSSAGDRLFLCKPHDGPLLALFCPRGSTVEQQFLWLFGLPLTEDTELQHVDLRDGTARPLNLAARQVLDLLGIEAAPLEEEWLNRLIDRFGERFPTTRQFSEFARMSVANVNPVEDPDLALLEWMETEELLFMTFERHIVGKALVDEIMRDGKPDVDAFVRFSLSVHNRRKSRAGWSLGNHIEALLVANKIRYKREATTEKRNGPDFLFPGETEYHNPLWPVAQLTMLGVKTSAKDRWRQVLAEANRIEQKHLLTLEPGISRAQTDEMKAANLQLVLPKGLHESYRPEQQGDLLDMASFLELVRDRQE